MDQKDEIKDLENGLKKALLEKILAGGQDVRKTPENSGKSDTTLQIIKELSAQLPSIIKQVKEAKQAVPPSNPVQSGLEEAVRETAKALTLEILKENLEMRSNLKAMLEESLAESLMERKPNRNT